ncbi:DUF2523 domain-containing protein [Thalassolituus sp. ST750PaO-4]|uniref:DUF2523 family protein n=1 Tax=Thalassolituus sp. ST750PaO-4 TaxID=2742965 RepID=UPI001CE2D01F|nr:DUF2523 family protein [Thalassolituus sp. ST750PaO-4]MCA6058306.1 DUF2523 domain-containing protein [Thalassolituus sp. ST750PaO-4]
MIRYIPLFLLLAIPVSGWAADSGSAVETLSMYDSLFTTESYTWIDTVFERVAAWLILWWLEIKLFAVAFSYDIAVHLVQQLGIVNQIKSTMSGLNQQVYAFLDYLNVLEALNIVLSAHAARLVLGIM